ncbi:hypothetical protein [Nesterenkonia sphaerica]|uniref:Uncharacterized protein n=1 Tax=Nesterenkonia sphaerica TaxID=1804988 RepID=A0A5R9APV1_9MICC|nr:hypothetical protein [Nesterenkonia sphaerica]TLP80044.1 hypothetical protein FEF27_01325 [Nesterenkonia sphaerica]
MAKTFQRVIGVAILLGAGALSLPVAASFLDGPSTDNWIVPAQMGAMAVIGAVCGLALPAMVPAGASTPVRALFGTGLGLLAAAVGLGIFWILLNGLGGA